MSVIELCMRQPVAQAIGWALLQFVWQGARPRRADGASCWPPCDAARPTSATSSAPSVWR